MRTLGGEDSASMPAHSSSGSSSSASDNRDRYIINSLQADSTESDQGVVAEHEEELAAAEWALERESELARLEQENAFLRQLAAEHLNIASETNSSGSGAATLELPRLSSLPKVPARTYKGKLGGRDVGPFGMYKKFEE